MRPPGYEPGELPTAPLRDISLFAGAKVILFLETTKHFHAQITFFTLFKHKNGINNN